MIKKLNEGQKSERGWGMISEYMSGTQEFSHSEDWERKRGTESRAEWCGNGKKNKYEA
jgi:hypothetical protein